MLSFARLIAAALRAADLQGRFDAQEFFRQWFRECGNAYFFVFKKNFRVTNIQQAELQALIRSHIAHVDGTEEVGLLRLLAYDYDEFTHGLQALVDTFPADTHQPLNRYDLVSRIYAPLLQRALVVQPYFGSCAVYLPADLQLNLEAICGLSGYIHACGPIISISRVDRSRKEELVSSLRRHLQKEDTPNRLRFVVYCHEDYTGFDRASAFERASASQLRGGLDDLKIHLEKFYMGDAHLVSVIRDLQDQFASRLVIPLPNDYRKQYRAADLPPDGKPLGTIWLLLDHALDTALRQRSDNAYFICYEQRFCNKNPYHILDENKPAWVAHTTVPHSLVGAMINLTRPWWPSGAVQFTDPFVGSGTSWLEALKDPRLHLDCSDLHPMAPLLAADNLRVFSASEEEALSYVDLLCRELSIDRAELKKDGDSLAAITNLPKIPDWVHKILDNIGGSAIAPEDDFPLNLVTQLERRTFEDRLLFYVALRVIRRHAVAFERGSRTESGAYQKELLQLAAELMQLAYLRGAKPTCDDKHMSCVSMRYSLGCTLTQTYLAGLMQQKCWEGVKVRDVLSLGADSYDVIIADPPYGFNTNDDLEALAGLYVGAIEVMVRALRAGGQLVLCLPERSRIGRRVPYFMQKEIVIQQVLTTAEKVSRQIMPVGFTGPAVLALFHPPYFWESERALRRTILHFRFT